MTSARRTASVPRVILRSPENLPSLLVPPIGYHQAPPPPLTALASWSPGDAASSSAAAGFSERAVPSDTGIARSSHSTDDFFGWRSCWMLMSWSHQARRLVAFAGPARAAPTFPSSSIASASPSSAPNCSASSRHLLPLASSSLPPSRFYSIVPASPLHFSWNCNAMCCNCAYQLNLYV